MFRLIICRRQCIFLNGDHRVQITYLVEMLGKEMYVEFVRKITLWKPSYSYNGNIKRVLGKQFVNYEMFKQFQQRSLCLRLKKIDFLNS
jgi:hypothetical protein